MESVLLLMYYYYWSIIAGISIITGVLLLESVLLLPCEPSLIGGSVAAVTFLLPVRGKNSQVRRQCQWHFLPQSQ